MQRSVLLIFPTFLVIVAASLFGTGAASASEPTVVVIPPSTPAGPIPIPYPNLNAVAPQSRSAFKGFLKAQAATGGVIYVQTGGTIE